MARHINVVDMFHGDNREAVPDFMTMRNNGIFGVIHKATEGLHYADPKYAARRAAAKAAGILFGAYHFLHNADPVEQAKHFLATAQPDDDLLLAADFEKSAHTPALHQLRDFVQYVDANSSPGVSTVIYSGDLIRESLKPSKGGHVSADMTGAQQFFASHRLWLAEYGPHENIPWPWNTALTADRPAPGVWLWQYTETAIVAGVRGKVDGNYSECQTQEELATRWLA